MKKFLNFYNSNEILKIIISTIFFFCLSTPININYIWNFLSILGTFLIIQIISHYIILSTHYCPNIDIAFWSITNIIKDINSSWLFRLIHINGVLLYFIVIYIHNKCNIFYYSYKLLRVWEIGNWNFNSFNINSSSIYRLCFTLRTNIILISYSYYNFIISN